MQRIRKAALVCCSNPISTDRKDEIEKLKNILQTIGIETAESPCIFSDDVLSFLKTEKNRADALLNFYKDKTVDAIFDISGGDLSNTILNYLDFDIIKNNPKPFFGYSDLTALINALYSKTSASSFLYQIRNIIKHSGSESPLQRFNDFNKSISDDFLNFKYRFLRGESFSGILIGGNIRCFLKLAGTEFFPDLSGKVLLLESLGGDVPKISSMFAQLKSLKSFEKVNGVILGTFTQLEKEQGTKAIEEIALHFIDEKTPVVKTEKIGHSPYSRAVEIGKNIFIP